MAIFYKHIKGTTNATSNNDGLWTWIKWSSEKLINSTVCSPEIWVTNRNEDINPSVDPVNAKNLGHIITSHATNQNIYSKIFIPQIELEQIQTPNDDLFLAAEGIHVYPADSWDTLDLQNDWYWRCNKTSSIQSKINYAFLNDQNLETVKISSTDGNITTLGGLLTQKQIIVGDASNAVDGQYIQAPYFNATSDIRAKENLSPLSTNALDIIKKVQVYTFNYKNNPKERTIGVIAQEFLDKKLDDVSLVANEGASGENGDYMSIKETKLIYLLLKGMQEQQTEIDDLKEQIKKLESK